MELCSNDFTHVFTGQKRLHLPWRAVQGSLRYGKLSLIVDRYPLRNTNRSANTPLEEQYELL